MVEVTLMITGKPFDAKLPVGGIVKLMMPDGTLIESNILDIINCTHFEDIE